jgi:hypothetical protein
MGKYDEVVNRLTEVDDDTLHATHSEAKARIAELRPKIADRSLSSDELGELAGLKDAFTSLNGEVGARAEKREADYAAADELASLTDEPQEPETEPVAEQEEPEATPEAEEKAEEPVSESEPELVAASATPKAPKMGEVTKAAPKAPAGKPAMSITAAADVHGFYAGQQLEVSQIGKALQSRLRSVANSGQSGDGESVVVASINANDVPEDRVLKAGDSVEVNTNKIHRVTSQQAITAAGGLCAPLAIDYNYGVWGTQGRPIRDSLPGFQVERGGIQFRRDLSPMINAATDGPMSATGFWSMQNDVDAEDPANYEAGAATPGPLKALWVVDCPPTETAQVETITFQVEFANISSRFDPETLQANTEAALVWHDRICENHLLAQLQAKSKVMTSGTILGATRDLLVTFDKAQTYYRSVHRLSSNMPLRAILPFWAKAMIRSDLARQFNDDSFSSLNVTDAQIDGFFASRNIIPVWHLDGNPAADTMGTSGSTTDDVPAQQYLQQAAGTAVPDYPTKVDILLHPEGHFQHLDGGVLDLGIVRDAQLVRRNRYRQFSESFEGIAARGVEALRLVASVTPNGAMSGTINPTTITA